MKPFIYLVAIIFCCSCKENTSPVLSISRDTLHINIRGSLEQAIKYQNKYYCFFSVPNPYASMGELTLYILAENGKVERSVYVPDEMQNLYLDLHIRNDSILYKDYYDKTTYYLDTNKWKWVKVNTADDLVFEDENYYVTALDFGEWGGTMWFRNKKTGNEYEMFSKYPIVNRLNGKYYVTKGRQVYVIDDPSKLKKSCIDSTYGDFIKNGWHSGSNSVEGLKSLVFDSSFLMHSKFYIATSFIYNNKLRHICVDSSKGYVAKIDSGRILLLDTIGQHFIIYHHHNSYRRNLYKRSDQFWHIQANDGTPGFLEISNNHIRVRYIINHDTANYLGSPKAEKAFEALFNYCLSRAGTISIKQIDSIETKLGGRNATPRHKMEIGTDLYPNKNDYQLESPRVYKRIEDSTFTCLANYYSVNKEKSVKVVSFTWEETYESLYNIYASKDDNFLHNKYQCKFEYIKSYIARLYGAPARTIQTGGGVDLVWETPSKCTIKLFYDNADYKNIYLLMYKD